MRRTLLLCTLTPAILLFTTPKLRAADAAPAPKYTYQDHILPILRNTCLNCHNPDKKKGNLDLSTYSGLSTGGGSGKAVEPGDPDSSKLFKAVSWAEEPNMPPKGDKLSEKDLAIIKAWIAGGAPETSGSKVVINKPKTNLAVVAVTGKPEGPIAMPKDLSIEPVATPRHPAALTALAASPWAPLIAVGGQRQIVLYHADTLELLGILPFPEGIPYSLKFSRNGSLLIAGGGIGAKSGKVVAFDVATGKRVVEVGDEFDVVLAADLSPDQTRVALGTPLRTLKIYDTSDGSQEQAIKKHTDWIQAVAYSPDGRFLASGDRAGGLWVWEGKTARELYNCAGHKEGVTDVAFRGDSSILASASQDGTIKLWNMSDGTMAKTIQAHSGGVLSLAFTHDGKLVSCGRDHLVKLWAPDGAPLKTFEPFNDIALRAAITHDGQRVVAGDYTGVIRVWNAADGKRVGDLVANPPTLADQLAGFDQRLKDLTAAADKAKAELKSAQEAAAQAERDLQSATQAEAAAKKTLETGKAQIEQLTAGVTTKAKAAKESLPAKQAAAEAAAATKSKAKSALAAAKESLQSLKSKPADKTTADDDRANAIAAKEQEIKSLEAALAKAEADAKSAAEAVTQTKAAGKQTVEGNQEIAALKQSLAKAKSDLEAAPKLVKSKTESQKSTADRLAKAQAAATQAAQQLEAAKSQKSRLEASLKQQPAKSAKS